MHKLQRPILKNPTSCSFSATTWDTRPGMLRPAFHPDALHRPDGTGGHAIYAGIRRKPRQCPVSAPSRATIMTGQHSGHGHVRGNKEYWLGEVWYGQNKEYAVTGQEPYDPQHIILPEIMKKNGYTTGMFGKWAGGYEGSTSTPDKRGVDEYFGYMCQFQAHLYYPNFLNSYSRAAGDTAVSRVILEDNIRYPMSGEDYFKRTQYSADLIHQKALEWLDKQDGKQPFYGFLTYTLPHAELVQPNDSILKKYKKQFFHDKTWGGDAVPATTRACTHMPSLPA